MSRPRERWSELREQFLGDFREGIPFAERSAHADAWASRVEVLEARRAELERRRDHWHEIVEEIIEICDEHSAPVNICGPLSVPDRVSLVLHRLEARVAELEAAAVADAPPGVGDGGSSAEEFVHLCSWSGQPDLYIPCVQLWTSPFWWPERLPPLPRGVFYAEQRDNVEEVWGRYAFEVERVTCPACLEAHRTGNDQPQEGGR